jgi:hypothetical protein
MSFSWNSALSLFTHPSTYVPLFIMAFVGSFLFKGIRMTGFNADAGLSLVFPQLNIGAEGIFLCLPLGFGFVGIHL